MSGRLPAGPWLLALAAWAVSTCGGAPGVDPTAATAAHFESIRDDPAEVAAFLADMPLGGDLHHHVGGGNHPATLIRFAADDGLCLPADADTPWVLTPPPCGDGYRPVADALQEPDLQREIERRWSMRDYLADDPAIDREAANAYFFAAFDKPRLARQDFGRTLAGARSEAAAGGAIYLETTSTLTPDPSGRDAISADLVWSDDLRAMRRQVLDHPLFDATREAVVDAYQEGHSRSELLLGCGGPTPDPGCGVLTRFQRLVLRMLDARTVFAHIVLAYEVARASPLVVGINFAGPETHEVALADYALHMRMFGLMTELYPDVPLTLHTGEMTAGRARALGAIRHIGLAIAPPTEGGAGARRVGHAVALDAAPDRELLLQQMQARDIAIEINLESNRQLLGTDPVGHAMLDYLAAGVPVVLATDDPGPMLTDLREQFALAARNERVGYVELRAMALASIRHSFLPVDDKEALLERLREELARFEASFTR